MKKILVLLVLCLNVALVFGQEYKNWEKYEIEGFYLQAQTKEEAKNHTTVLREGANYYIPTDLDDQLLPLNIGKRITPKLYKLKDTEMYAFFTLPPFLFESDSGIIEVKNNKGIFYKKPTQ